MRLSEEHVAAAPLMPWRCGAVRFRKTLLHGRSLVHIVVQARSPYFTGATPR